MQELLALAGQHDLQVVEDCAQAIGAHYHGRSVVAWAASVVSVSIHQEPRADGDGGMIVTSDEALVKKLRMLRVHGIERRYHHELHGYNSRLDELQAAVLRSSCLTCPDGTRGVSRSRAGTMRD